MCFAWPGEGSVIELGQELSQFSRRAHFRATQGLAVSFALPAAASDEFIVTLPDMHHRAAG